MKKVTDSTAEDVRSSVSSLYSSLLAKRQQMKEQEEQAEAERRAEKEKKYIREDGTKMSKKERRQLDYDNWKELVVSLTGDDLEYTNKGKKGKKKYPKWIDDETDTITTVKQKKPKKKNYNKEFEPELNMLRSLVADQNKFTADLQKRFINAAGPATKDASPLTKNVVDLATAITSGRSNSLNMLREIGNLKKVIANLYMEQKKMEDKFGGNSQDTTDVGLLGSSIAASMFNNPVSYTEPSTSFAPVVTPQQPVVQQQVPVNTAPVIEEFDPNSWDGPQLSNTFAATETIPHTIYVEKNNTTGTMRFVALRDDNGEELPGCCIPTTDPSTLVINEKENTVKGQFDEVYKIRTVG